MVARNNKRKRGMAGHKEANRTHRRLHIQKQNFMLLKQERGDFDEGAFNNKEVQGIHKEDYDGERSPLYGQGFYGANMSTSV